MLKAFLGELLKVGRRWEGSKDRQLEVERGRNWSEEVPLLAGVTATRLRDWEVKSRNNSLFVFLGARSVLEAVDLLSGNVDLVSPNIGRVTNTVYARDWELRASININPLDTERNCHCFITTTCINSPPTAFFPADPSPNFRKTNKRCRPNTHSRRR